MEEIEKIKKDVEDFVEKLLSLVPPYDRISILSKEIELSGSFKEISKTYSEFFHPEFFNIIQKILGIEVEGRGNISLSYNYGIGHPLNDLITKVYGIFDDDEFRKELSELLGKEIPIHLRSM